MGTAPRAEAEVNLEAAARALHARHSDDLIVRECKDGPSQNTSSLRLDYWVLRRSWTRPCMAGYEFKSSRADFLSDSKLHLYLPLCNELWVVADPGDVKPEELPDGVGMLRLAGPRLITVRNAAWRDVDPPIGLLTYVLMCRTVIKADFNRSSRSMFWSTWLEKRRTDRSLGYEVSKRIRELYAENVKRVENEIKNLRERIDSAERLERRLAELGIDEKFWSVDVTAKEIAERVHANGWQRARVKQARDALGELLGVDPKEGA